MSWTPNKLKNALNFLFPPYMGAGIKVTHLSDDWSHMRVELRERFYNRNALGTHFGGSLYSMVDPHFVLMLIPQLGKGYVVWDQAATIKFVKPGKGTVHADIRISAGMLDDIYANTESGNAYRPVYELQILDAAGETVAIVEKTLYVRKKKPK